MMMMMIWLNDPFFRCWYDIVCWFVWIYNGCFFLYFDFAPFFFVRWEFFQFDLIYNFVVVFRDLMDKWNGHLFRADLSEKNWESWYKNHYSFCVCDFNRIKKFQSFWIQNFFFSFCFYWTKLISIFFFVPCCKCDYLNEFFLCVCLLSTKENLIDHILFLKRKTRKKNSFFSLFLFYLTHTQKNYSEFCIV